jgi:hypothetical protein
MTYRTIYDKQTGRILRCIKMNDEMLAINLANNPHWASIDAEVKRPGEHCVNLNTLAVEKIEWPVDILHYIRQVRAHLLKGCDWTQMPDSPLSESKRAEWAVYRQALRDMPDTTTATTVEAIVWPVRP